MSILSSPSVSFQKAAKKLCTRLVGLGLALACYMNPVAAQPIEKPGMDAITAQKSSYVLEALNPSPRTARNFIVVAGPGRDAFDGSDVAQATLAAWNAGANVFLVGNARDKIQNEDLMWALKRARVNQLPTTLCLFAHGDVQEGVHKLDLTGSFETKTRDFLKLAQNTYGKPIDFVLFSCRGGASFREADVLSQGSSIAVFSGQNDNTQVENVQRSFDGFLKTIEETQGAPEDLTAARMFLRYASNVKEIEDNPGFLKKGEKAKDYDQAMTFLDEHPLLNNRFEETNPVLLDKAEKLLVGIMTRDEMRYALACYYTTKAEPEEKKKALIVGMACLMQGGFLAPVTPVRKAGIEGHYRSVL